jgi:glutathione reductase (NADPH)
MTKRFDLVVLGTGAAATTVAHGCREAGWQVAIVDSLPFGGTCALRGCDPKKVLVGAAEALDWARRMRGKGFRGDGVSLDWLELMSFKRTFTDPVPKNREESFAEAGITAFHGRAHFTSRTTIEVNDDVLESRYTVIATGAKPRKLNIPGETYITTSDQFLDLNSLPQRIVFMGGGYISMEFAHVSVRTDRSVTILHRGKRLLEGFDPDLVQQLFEKTQHLGATIHLQAEVKAIEKGDGGLVVHAQVADAEKTFGADLVVHGAGRVPDIEDLNLTAAAVETDKQGIKVNDYLQSISNSAVYAAGDVSASGGPPLTPVAGYEGRVVAANLLEGNHLKARYVGIPTVAFTIPALASVGLSEQSAREKGLKFRTHREITSSWYSSRRVAEDCSGFKVLIEDGSDRILGAHLLGPHAEEVINLFAFAIATNARAADLQDAIFAYPTLASDIRYML